MQGSPTLDQAILQAPRMSYPALNEPGTQSTPGFKQQEAVQEALGPVPFEGEIDTRFTSLHRIDEADHRGSQPYMLEYDEMQRPRIRGQSPSRDASGDTTGLESPARHQWERPFAADLEQRDHFAVVPFVASGDPAQSEEMLRATNASLPISSWQ
jgi:hypothetical protein